MKASTSLPTDADSGNETEGNPIEDHANEEDSAEETAERDAIDEPEDQTDREIAQQLCAALNTIDRMRDAIHTELESQVLSFICTNPPQWTGLMKFAVERGADESGKPEMMRREDAAGLLEIARCRLESVGEVIERVRENSYEGEHAILSTLQEALRAICHDLDESSNGLDRGEAFDAIQKRMLA